MTEVTEMTPYETDMLQAPGLVEGVLHLELTAEKCNIDYWLAAVPQGTLKGQVHGHAPEARVPPHMLLPGPLREALIDELAFRSIAEEKATRAISYLVASAPDIDSMEFFATQLIDEARHSRVFRGHLLDLGVPESELFATIERISG